MGNRIPDLARLIVRDRDRNRCARCGMPTGNGHWHHRRSRSVHDVHRHCPCNGVNLCPVCHADVHAEKAQAAQDGYVVSRYQAEPGTVPFKTPWGWAMVDCHGGAKWVTADNMSDAVSKFS